MRLHPYHKNRLVLLLAVLVAVVVFLWLGKWFDEPYHPGFGGSLLLQPVGGSVTSAVIVTLVGFFVSLSIATLIAGRLRADAGLFAAAIGMSVLTFRGGPARYVFQQTTTPRLTFLAFLLELALLGAILAVGWWMIWVLQRKGALRSDAKRDQLEPGHTSIGYQLSATGLQVLAIVMVMGRFAQSDDKMQVFGSLAAACGLSAYIVYWSTPTASSVWLWMGPLIAGAIGYFWTWWRWQDNLDMHYLYDQGFFAGLVRALPLDYASIGVAASIAGYWMSRRGKHLRVTEEKAAEEQSTQHKTASSVAI